VWEVVGVPPAPAITRAGPTRLQLDLREPGRTVLRGRRWTRFWRVESGPATVARDGPWLAVEATAGGRVTLRAAP
jgi:hypothetical protein